MKSAVIAVVVALGLVFTSAPAVSAHTSSPGAVKASKYRGKHYAPQHESIRKCLIHRESRGHYRVVNRYSGAAGAYQFMLGTSNEMARRMNKPWLIGVPASQWSRKKQDRAFWMLWNHGRGKSHWAGGSWRCW